jgi:hypothetical protein
MRKIIDRNGNQIFHDSIVKYHPYNIHNEEIRLSTIRKIYEHYIDSSESTLTLSSGWSRSSTEIEVVSENEAMLMILEGCEYYFDR